jgi:hypothetical protein
MMNRIFPVLFLLMSLTVATREIPELYKLMDDPSNDGQIFEWQSQPAIYTVQGVPSGHKAPTAHIIALSWNERFARAAFVPASVTRRILLLVCLLRT